MFYYVEIEDGKIAAKIEETKEFLEIPNNYKEISFELYQSIGMTPCSFEEIDGEIISVEHINLPPTPPPEPTPIERLEEENKLLKAQNNALSERADFVEDLIAEMAMMIYP